MIVSTAVPIVAQDMKAMMVLTTKVLLFTLIIIKVSKQSNLNNLGFIHDDKLNLKHQIETLATKCSKSCGILLKL